MLDALGLDNTSLLIYRLLLRRPDLDESEVAEQLQLSPQQVSSAVGTLKRLCLVRPSWDDPTVLHPVSPEAGLGALVADREIELVERRREIERAKVAVEGFAGEYARWRTASSRGEMEFLAGIDAIRGRIEELTADAKSEIVAFSMGVQSEDTIEAGRAVDQAALNRGLALRSLYLESINNHPATRTHARWLADRGAQVRTVPVLPLRMVIFDRMVALLPVNPEVSRDGAVMVSGKGLLTALLHLFEHTWADATPIGAAPARGDEGRLRAADRAVLGLLAQGLTDEAVARKLGVSLRTVRRMMARLMRQLGAQSRFEAGVRVAELGLVGSVHATE